MFNSSIPLTDAQKMLIQQESFQKQLVRISDVVEKHTAQFKHMLDWVVADRNALKNLIFELATEYGLPVNENAVKLEDLTKLCEEIKLRNDKSQENSRVWENVVGQLVSQSTK